jgi:hypothetical protein
VSHNSIVTRRRDARVARPSSYSGGQIGQKTGRIDGLCLWSAIARNQATEASRTVKYHTRIYAKQAIE